MTRPPKSSIRPLGKAVLIGVAIPPALAIDPGLRELRDGRMGGTVAELAA